MTDPTRQDPPPPDAPPPGTTVAVNNADEPKDGPPETPVDLGGVGDLPPDARNRIAIQRAKFKEVLAQQQNERAFVAASTKITWAKNLPPDALLKLAGWAKERDLDLLLEFHILGGSSGYVNAKWYMRQLGYLVADGVIEYAYYDVVNTDERIDTLATGEGEEAEWAKTERVRRARQRIQYSLPEEAIAAVIWHVKLHNMAREVTAAQACGGYRGKKTKAAPQNAPPGAREEEVYKDPIGEEFPRETAITRGCRKAMLALAHVAPRLQAKVDAAEAAAKEIAERLPDMAAEARAELRRIHGVSHVRMPTLDEYAGESRQVPAQATKDNRSD